MGLPRNNCLGLVPGVLTVVNMLENLVDVITARILMSLCIVYGSDVAIFL